MHDNRQRWLSRMALLLLVVITVLTGYPRTVHAARGTDWKEFLAAWSSDEGENEINSDDQKSDLGKKDTEPAIEEDGTYTSKDEVAAYIHIYDCLPQNYMTKKEAQKLGWISSEGNLEEVAPGKSIGGDRFGNYEELLPDEKGRSYRECDIDYEGGYRGSKRIIYSNDGLIFYTEDHYQTFEQLYDEEGRIE